MVKLLDGIADSVRYAMQNPFGLDFEVHGKKIYVPLGSALNCIGYNDFLERIVGVARITFAIISLASTLANNRAKKDMAIASGHIVRGILEIMGDFEKYLLILDVVFTAYNIAHRIFLRPSPSGAPATANNLA